MAENGFEIEPDPIPTFIRRKLEAPPILPSENAREFKTLFREIEFSAEGGKKTAADYMVDYQATVLIWNLQRIDRMIVAVIRHMHPTAVLALIRRTCKYSEAEPGSFASREIHIEAFTYFASEDAKKQIQERFAQAGYGPDAVEIEAFEQALAQITTLNRQQTEGRRQLLAFFKEIDRRNSRRAQELRKVAGKVVPGAYASAPEKGAAS
jgi:hypothetical protein